MLRQTPFHPRTAALNGALSWKEWSGYAATCSFDRHSEREYFAVRHTVGLLDVSPLFKLDLTGPEAGAMLARVFTRDIATIGVGRVVYGCLCDERGKVLDDGTVARLAPEHYRVTSSEPWLRWFRLHARGYEVEIEDTTDRIAALALQGPNARKVLKPIVEFDMDRMRFFRVRRTTLAGHPVWISRTGYTGDLGYEIWTANEHALKVWDALTEAGKPHWLQPIGLDALDVTRIEAGFVLQGIDYVSAKNCITESLKSTPEDAGLGWTVKLDKADFIGKEAIAAIKAAGPTRKLIGFEMRGRGVARDGYPLLDAAGAKIGHCTSGGPSPTLGKSIGLGYVLKDSAKSGTALQVDCRGRIVPAEVVKTPFYKRPRPN